MLINLVNERAQLGQEVTDGAAALIDLRHPSGIEILLLFEPPIFERDAARRRLLAQAGTKTTAARWMSRADVALVARALGLDEKVDAFMTTPPPPAHFRYAMFGGQSLFGTWARPD